MAERWKSDYFSVMKYFGFMILTRYVVFNKILLRNLLKYKTVIGIRRKNLPSINPIWHFGVKTIYSTIFDFEFKHMDGG